MSNVCFKYTFMTMLTAIDTSFLCFLVKTLVSEHHSARDALWLYVVVNASFSL